MLKGIARGCSFIFTAGIITIWNIGIETLVQHIVALIFYGLLGFCAYIGWE